MEKVLNIYKKEKSKDKIKTLCDKMFATRKSAIISLFTTLSILMGIYFLYIYLVNDNFYNNWSDDSLQYYPFMCDFIDSIKKGTFSLYSFKNYLGASFFSDTYYIPLDGFTLIIFVLSFLMNTEIAMSIVEILKMILGACALAYYLGIKNHKPKTIFLIGLFYFSSSGITCFSCFPCFTSLAFYLPFGLIIVDWYLKGKWQYVPLYAFGLVLYNYYLAYMVYAFMAFSVLTILILKREKFIKAIKIIIGFVLLVIIGLIMSMMVFLPSIKFVLSSTSRDVAGGGSLKGLLYMFEGYIELALTAILSFFKLLLNILRTPSGILKNVNIFSDSFIQTRYLYHVLKSTRYYNDVKVMNSFFEISEYYRMLSCTFTPLTASSFYGYQSSYCIEHISFYITGTGLLLSVYLWFLKDYKSNVYKVVLVITTIMMLLPFFSYIYSANLEVLYTRWFNVVTVPLLIIDAHVIDSEGLFNLKPKKLLLSFVIIIYFGILASANHLYTITNFGIDYEWDSSILSFEKSFFYYILLVLFIVILMMIGFYFTSLIKTKKGKVLGYIVTPVVATAFILVVAYQILLEFGKIPEDLIDLSSTLFVTNDIKGEFFSVDEQIALQYLIIVTLLLITLSVYSLIKKKRVMFSIVVGLEFAISACMSFGSCVIYSGREETFNNTHVMSDFLSECIEEVGTYRVYIDSSCGDYLETNTARLMPVGTNCDIFHSFIYAGTDDVAGLIFDKSDEGQAGKKALNTYSYYLNIFLGYKYVLASTDSSFSNYNTSQFSLVRRDEELGLMLLEFKDYEEFICYDEYISGDSFDSIKQTLKAITREKLMIEKVIISQEYLDIIKKYFLCEADTDTIENITSSQTFTQKKSIETKNADIINMDGHKYYKYSFSSEDEITTRSYAINLFGFEDEIEELIANKQVFLEFENGERYYLDSENIREMCGSTVHIPIYGDSNKNNYKPKCIYIGADDSTSVYAPTLRYTVEAIFAPTNYFNSYENGEDLPEDAYLEAAIRFHIGGKISNNTILFELSKYSSGTTTLSYSTMYIEYMDGEFEQASQEMSISKEINNIYIVKSDDILSLSTPPTLRAVSYVLENNTNKSLINKSISVKGSKIILSYDREELNDEYSLIMIPTAYSDEWTVIEGSVEEVLPVNGGFIGVIVKNNLATNKIVLKFKPNGLSLGIILSIIGFCIYIGLVIITRLVSKRKEAQKI